MQQQPDSSLTKWMVILAWICGFGLLAFVFADLLESQINPNRSPSSSNTGGFVEVTLLQNRQGHYVASGTINNEPVVFLVDTGATDVSIPAHLADELGLIPQRRTYAQTANGVVEIAETQLNSITLGDITLRNVDANLNPGMQGEKILLGMSFLKQIEFTQRGDALILRTL